MEDRPSNFFCVSFFYTVIFLIWSGDVTEPATEEEKDEKFYHGGIATDIYS